MKLNKIINAPAKIVVTGVGLGILGDKLGTNSLSQAGAVSLSFLSPAISLSSGGYIVNQLRELKPKEDKNGIQNKRQKANFKF